MVVDRSVEPCSGHVVVVAYQGSFLMRPLLRQGEQQFLWTWRPLIAQAYLAWWCMQCITLASCVCGRTELGSIAMSLTSY